MQTSRGEETAAKLKLIKARSRFMTGSLLMTAFMLLTVLNGLLAGKFGDDAPELYSPAAHWPWIPLPAWLVIAVALLAPISVATMLRHLTREEIPQLVYLVMMTLVTYTASGPVRGLVPGFQRSPDHCRLRRVRHRLALDRVGDPGADPLDAPHPRELAAMFGAAE